MLPSPVRYHAAMMQGDGGGDQIAPKRPQPCERTFLVAARQAAEADHVSGKYGCEFPSLCHGSPLQKTRVARFISRAALRIREPRRGSFAAVRERL